MGEVSILNMFDLQSYFLGRILEIPEKRGRSVSITLWDGLLDAWSVNLMYEI